MLLFPFSVVILAMYIPLVSPSAEIAILILLFFCERTLFPSKLNTSTKVIIELPVVKFHKEPVGLGYILTSMML